MKRAMKRAALLAVALISTAAVSSARAQGSSPRVVEPPSLDAPVASAAVSARRVILARSFFLVVRVVYAPGIEVTLPTNLDFGGALEELRRTNAKQVNADGTLTREFELEVMAFVTGQVTIPPIEVTYTGRGEKSAVRTNPVAFEVSGVIGDGEGELRDIADPVRVLRRDYTLVYVLAAALAALLLLLVVFAILRRWRRRRRAVARRVAARVLPPDEEALARLLELESRGSVDQDDLKSVYLEMSEILKTYIARRFGFPASELTTLEIRNELAARPHGERAEALVRSWLESADLVKFANQRATSDEARRALYDARAFVEKTRRSAMVAVAVEPTPEPDDNTEDEEPSDA